MIETLQEWQVIIPPLMLFLNSKIILVYIIMTMSGKYLTTLANIKYKTEKHSETTKELKSEIDKVKVEKSELESKLTTIEEQVAKNKEKLNKISLASTFKGEFKI